MQSESLCYELTGSYSLFLSSRASVEEAIASLAIVLFLFLELAFLDMSGASRAELLLSLFSHVLNVPALPLR